MSFFPIVQRELAVAARSRRQFRLRMVVTVGCAALCFLLVFAWSFGAGRGGGAGSLFRVLSSIFWVICLGSGIFLTADCISREKREGTLGLLFLTDLKGYDIILGKLVSASWMTLMIVVGVMPVLTFCVLMGGVTGWDILRFFAGLLLTMVFSLSLGMLVSTFVRASTRAGFITFLALFLMGVGLPVMIKAATLLPRGISEAMYILNFVSPSVLEHTNATAANVGNHFAIVVIVVMLLSCVMLAISSVYVRSSWHDRPEASASIHPVSRGTKDSQRKPIFSSRNPRRHANPIVWLAGEYRWKGWCAAIATGAILVVGIFAGPPIFRSIIPFFMSFVIPYLLALGIAVHAARFFVTARRNGMLELLVSTPITDREILDGQFASLKQRYFPMAMILILIIWLPGGSVGPYPNLKSGLHAFSGETAARFYLMLRVGVLWAAAAWAGVYFGLKAKKTQFAAVQAVIIGAILPALCWCVPEIMVTSICLTICHSKLDGQIRQTIRAKIEAGQLV